VDIEYSGRHALVSRWRPMKDEVVAENGVVTANHPQAAEAGMRMLEEGGNAVDAGVATGFVNTVVAPYSAGIAGQGIMLVYMAEEGMTVAIDFNARSPRAATTDMYEVVGVEDGHQHIRGRERRDQDLRQVRVRTRNPRGPVPRPRTLR